MSNNLLKKYKIFTDSSSGSGGSGSTPQGGLFYIVNQTTGIPTYYSTIKDARDAAVSGDTVFVNPQIIEYDNRNSTSNQWNGLQADINLWKDGVTYHFFAGAKIIFYNETDTGEDLYLFKPLGNTFQTCSVTGDLEYEQYCDGPDTSIGLVHYFNGLTVGTDVGYTFYSHTKTITSYCNEPIRVDRGVTIASSSIIAKIDIVGEFFKHEYVAGNTGSGGSERIAGSDAVLEYTSNFKRRYIDAFYPYYFSSNLTRSKVNLYGEELYNIGEGNILNFLTLTGTINVNISNMYYNTAFATVGHQGAILSTTGAGAFVLNLNGNLIDYSSNSNTSGLFWLRSSGCVVNYNGDIFTNTSSGVGRFIVTTTDISTANINSNIYYTGSSVTTSPMFDTTGGAVVNYTGKTSGNFACTIARTLSGSININNAYIISSIINANSLLAVNGSTSLGILNISNSYIKLTNNSAPIVDGQYLLIVIDSSYISNLGTGGGTTSVIANSTAFGALRLLDTTIAAGTATYSINCPSITVSSSCSNVNLAYSIPTLYGTIQILTGSNSTFNFSNQLIGPSVLTDTIVLSTHLRVSVTDDSTAGTGVTLTFLNTPIKRLTGAVVSINGQPASFAGTLFKMQNATGNDVWIEYDAAGTDGFLNGTGRAYLFKNHATLSYYYCSLNSRYMIEGDGPPKVSIPFFSSSFSMVSSTSYFLDNSGRAASTTENLRTFKFADIGYVRQAVLNLFQSNAGVTNEAISLYLRNSTTATDYLLGTFTVTGTVNTGFTFNVTTANTIKVNTTDLWTVKIDVPSMVSAPTGVILNGLLMSEG